MSVTAAVANVELSIAAARRCVTRLTSIAQDRPAGHDVVVGQLVTDAVDDLDGWLAQAAYSASVGLRAADARDLDAVARALRTCRRSSDEVLRRFVTELLGYDSIDRLRQLAKDRPGPWTGWAAEVQDALTALWPAVWAIHESIETCWYELVERLISDPLFVTAHVVPARHAPAGRRDTKPEGHHGED